MTKPQTFKPPIEPLAVSLAGAAQLLSIGQTHLHELLAAGELESFCSGRARRFTTRSI